MNDIILERLVRIDQQPIALLFTDYLISLGICAETKQEDGAYIIWCDQSKYEQAKSAFNEFIHQPYHPKYQQAAWENGDTSNNVSLPSSGFSGIKEQFIAHAGIVTLVIFIACWLVYIGSVLGFSRDIFSVLHFYPALSFEAIINEPLRLLGPAFFHFSLLHIAFNTMWWWQLGGAIEKVFGKITLINLFLISTILSNIGQLIASGPNFGGLSGVVYAVVGFVWWIGWLAPEKGLSLSKPIIAFLVGWLLLGYVDILPINMANTAHTIGLISGCLLAFWQVKVMKPNKE